MSRYLELARFPSEVVACFQSPHVIGISHAARLAPLLGNPLSRVKILEEARALAAESGAAGVAPSPAGVIARLVGVAAGRAQTTKKARKDVVKDDQGRILLSVIHGSKGDVSFSVPKARLGDARQLVEAIGEHLSELGRAVKQRR